MGRKLACDLAPIGAGLANLINMYELHQNEQYFFDERTLQQLADFVSRFENPCCLCAPLLGEAPVNRGRRVRILDIDTRFASLPGFVLYEVQRPRWLGERFDLLVCDPPFYNVSLSRLFAAVRTLALNDYGQALLISYLRRRSPNVLGTFAPFRVRPTGYFPGYRTVEACERNEIEFYGNLAEEQLASLLAAQKCDSLDGPVAAERSRRPGGR